MRCSARRKRSSFALLTVLALGGSLASCHGPETHPSVIWTNIPGVLPFVDRFNALQTHDQLVVEYRENPSRALSAGDPPDLIVSRDLASSERKMAMADLSFLFDDGALTQAAFYRHILDAGEQGGQIRLLPISFDLPIVIFSRQRLPDLAGFSLNAQQLSELNAQFNATVKDSSRRLAFSPLWGDAGLQWLALGGAWFRESFSGELTWDSAGLTKAIKEINSWPLPPRDVVHEFQKKYLGTDVTGFLDSGRIQFFPSTLSQFLARPWDERRTLDFRYVDRSGKLFATDSVVWAGLPLEAPHPGAARAFLKWFFHADTQVPTLRTLRQEDPRDFGLADGLSSLVAVNAQISREIDGLQGRLPTADQVQFWSPLPQAWTSLKTSILLPWISSTANDEPSLMAALEKRRNLDATRATPQP